MQRDEDAVGPLEGGAGVLGGRAGPLPVDCAEHGAVADRDRTVFVSEGNPGGLHAEAVPCRPQVHVRQL